MKKSIVLIICLMSLFIKDMSAQEKDQNRSHFGVYFGLGINDMDIDESLLYDDSKVLIDGESAYYEPIVKAPVKQDAELIFGGFYEYDIIKNLALHVDLFYCQYGYKIDGIVNYVIRCIAITKMHNINTAVMLKIKPLSFLSVDLGVQPSYCFSAIKTIDKVNYIDKQKYNSNKEYNPFNFSVKAGVSLYLKKIFLSVGYSIGMVDVLNVKTPHVNPQMTAIDYTYSPARSRTNSIQVTIGYRI